MMMKREPRPRAAGEDCGAVRRAAPVEKTLWLNRLPVIVVVSTVVSASQGPRGESQPVSELVIRRAIPRAHTNRIDQHSL